MSQDEFFCRLVDTTDCGLLLDVANVYINAMNHRFDSVAFHDTMPLNAVVQIHLAGGCWVGGVYIDARSERVNDATWDLPNVRITRVPSRVSILEQDTSVPNVIEPLLADAARSRGVVTAAGRA